MKVIIIGDGKLGFNLAENLSREDNDVTIIDKNPEALRKADGRLDVMCIKGNGLEYKRPAGGRCAGGGYPDRRDQQR